MHIQNKKYTHNCEHTLVGFTLTVQERRRPQKLDEASGAVCWCASHGLARWRGGSHWCVSADRHCLQSPGQEVQQPAAQGGVSPQLVQVVIELLGGDCVEYRAEGYKHHSHMRDFCLQVLWGLCQRRWRWLEGNAHSLSPVLPHLLQWGSILSLYLVVRSS